MKKLLFLTLALFMLLPMVACAKKEPAPAADNGQTFEGLHIGYAREKVMPDLNEEIPMGGYGNSEHRLAQDYLDYLYITCVAFSEGDQTVLLFTQDQISSNSTLVEKIREGLSAQTGIPQENILLSATHSHSTPDLGSTDYPGIVKFRNTIVEMGISAGLKALEDRAPATMYGGYATVEGMNFIRHYLMNDGTYHGSNFGSTESGFKSHAAENDPTMGLLKIDREGDKDDILLMNWAAHPCFTGGINKYTISADYIGQIRNNIEAQTGMKFAFFLAAAGNHNTNSLMKEDKHNLENDTYGQALAQAAIDALPSLTKLEGSGVATSYQDVVYELNREDIDKIAQAREVYDLFHETGDRGAGNALANQYGMSSVYHASAVISRAKNNPGDTRTFRIHATKVGNFSFVNAPYEMFAASGKEIRENSPFATTFIITCSNSAQGYFPTMEAFAYGCYESFTTPYARGIAEHTVAEYGKLLNSLQ